MKTNGNGNADASANNNTNMCINTKITERAWRAPKIRITSRTRCARPSRHIRRPRRTHAKPTDCYQVFGIFGPSFWDFWLRNWTKNLVQKLHQKLGQANGIDAKTWRGNQFKMRLQKIGSLWRAYTESTRTNFLEQFLDHIFGPGSGPRFWTSSGPRFLVQFLSQNFMKIGKKISLARKIPPSQAEKNARAPSENHNAEASPACTHCCQRKCMWPPQVDRTGYALHSNMQSMT